MPREEQDTMLVSLFASRFVFCIATFHVMLHLIITADPICSPGLHRNEVHDGDINQD